MAKPLQLLCILLLLGVAGCGFQLRASNITALDELYLSGKGAAPLIYRELKAAFDSQGIATTSDSMDAFRLRLLDERSIRRSVATTSLIDAAEYELRLEVDVSMSRGDEELARDTLVTQRVYAVDAVNLSASTEEQRLLMQEMRDEMVETILRRVEILIRIP